MTNRDFTQKELLRIAIMRDIFENIEIPDHIYKVIDNLFITDKQKRL